MVMLKTTDCAKKAGLRLELTVEVVAAWPIVSLNVEEVLPVRFAFPLYTAVMLWEPTARKDTVS